MKGILSLAAIAFLVTGHSDLLKADDMRCDNLAVPYKKVTTEDECQKMYSPCWYDGKCYDVDPSGCQCLKSGAKFCSMTIGGGNETEYCLWGDKACDSWRFLRKQCRKPGIELSHYPPNQEDFCRMKGGTVSGESCLNWTDSAGKIQPICSLEKLWNLDCPEQSH